MGKIVRFELFHDGVDLYESSEGFVVSDALPSRRLLTTFPITSQDEQRVVIDFNAGMRRVFNQLWYSVAGLFNSGTGSRSLEIPLSRVFEVREQGEELVIRQSAQARDRQFDPNREERYELRYFISPYAPGDVTPKENSILATRYLRFFETAPLLEPKSGRSSSKIARFDIRKPVLIHYSANTPPEYEQAVKDGILYWNRAFGKEVIQVEKAPEGTTAPDARYNLVQWVPWDAAGFAYADLLVDPKTGTSLHGQAYMHSGFSIAGKARARALLRTMRAVADAKPEPAPKSDKGDPAPPALPEAASFLTPSHACHLDPTEYARTFAAGLEAILAEEGLEEKAAAHISQDYIRYVVAHEVGHMLGLRHNFAGSLAGNLSRKEMDAWFKAYVTDPQTPLFAERISTSSVMEYSNLKASVFAGASIRKGTQALPHDLASIRWGYFDHPEVLQQKPLFATDEDITAFGDAMPGDYGSEPILSAYGAIGDLLRNLPHSLVETFIRAKAPEDPRDQRPLETVDLRPEFYTRQLLRELNLILHWFQSNTRSLKVENPFPLVGESNRKELHQAHWNALRAQIEKLGGIDRAIFSILPLDLKLDTKLEPKDVESAEKVDARKLTDRLAKLLESPAYATFVGLDDKTYSFTKQEKELILQRGKKFFEDFEKKLLKGVCLTLERTPRDLGVKTFELVGEDDEVAKLEKRIIDVAREVILKRSEDERRKGKVDRASVEVADFKYDLETRLAAARMLSDSMGTFKGWAAEAKSETHRQLKEMVEGSLNIQNFKSFHESQLSRPLRDWYLNQQSILGVLPARPSAPASPANPPQHAH